MRGASDCGVGTGRPKMSNKDKKDLKPKNKFNKSIESSRNILPFTLRKLKGNVEVQFDQYRRFIVGIKTVTTNSYNFRSTPSCFRTCRSNNDYDNEQFCITHKYT